MDWSKTARDDGNHFISVRPSRTSTDTRSKCAKGNRDDKDYFNISICTIQMGIIWYKNSILTDMGMRVKSTHVNVIITYNLAKSSLQPFFLLNPYKWHYKVWWYSKFVVKNGCKKEKVTDDQRLSRRERDSNPRYPYEYTGFQDRLIRPLWHLSKTF